jgi:hypothetical protein
VPVAHEVKSLRSTLRSKLKCMRSGRSMAVAIVSGPVTQATQRVHRTQSFRSRDLVLILAEQNNDG